MIDDAGGHRSAVVESSELSEGKDRAIMDIENVAGIIRLDLDEGRDSPPLGIARPEINTQGAVVYLVGDRHARMVCHPRVAIVGPEDEAALLPAHRQPFDLWDRLR